MKMFVLFEMNCLMLETLKDKQQNNLKEAKQKYQRIIDCYGVNETEKQMQFLRNQLGIESVALEELDLDDELCSSGSVHEVNSDDVIEL